MEKFIIFTFSLLLLVSCGKGSKGDKLPAEAGDQPKYSWTEAIREPQNYSDLQASIGLNICKALRHKRERYMSASDRTFRHILVPFTKTCYSARPFQGRAVTATVRNVRNAPLYFETARNSDTILTDVITDEYEKLEPICVNLLRGNTNISNTIRRGGIRYQVFFFQNGSQQFLNIVDFKVGRDNRLFPYKQDIVGVMTSTSTNNLNLLGISFVRTENKSCSNGETSYLSQKVNF